MSKPKAKKLGIFWRILPAIVVLGPAALALVYASGCLFGGIHPRESGGYFGWLIFGYMAGIAVVIVIAAVRSGRRGKAGAESKNPPRAR